MAISRILKGFSICQWYHFKPQLNLSLLVYGMYRLINLEVKGHRYQALTFDYMFESFSVSYPGPSLLVSFIL